MVLACGLCVSGAYDLPMLKIGLIALAAAAGALSRYGIGRALGVRSFPWTTLGINLSGSLLLGLLVAIGIERNWSETTMVPLTRSGSSGRTRPSRRSRTRHTH
jgi:fluoride ion exporter CrcB/FEX